jgi:alkylation response protein AidB-like acyl-CoA dehydrogenase
MLVDLDSPGITVQPTRAITGRNEFAEVFFDDAVVPRDRLVGELGEGWPLAMHMLQWERGMFAWQRQAYLHRRLADLAGAVASGAARGAGAGARLVDAYLAVFALRMKCRQTLRLLAAGENPGPDISIDKILLAGAEQTVFDAVRDLLEPDVLFGDGDTSREWRSEYFYTRSASIYGGTAEIQRDIVANHVLGLPRG